MPRAWAQLVVLGPQAGVCPFGEQVAVEAFDAVDRKVVQPGMCDAEFNGASIPHVAAVFVVGRVALVDEVALPVSTAGRDMGQPTYTDVDQFVTTNGLAVNTLRPLV